MTGLPDSQTAEEARQEAFVAAWSDLIGLYRVIAMPAETTGDLAMRREAMAQFNRHADRYKLGISASALLRQKPTEVIDLIAPKMLLLPPPEEVLPSGPFGPLVTAASPEALKAQVERLRSDPRIMAQLSRSGYLYGANLV